MSISSVLVGPAPRNAPLATRSAKRRRDAAPRPLALVAAALLLCLGMLAPVAAFVLSTPSNQNSGLSVSCLERNANCRINAFSPNTSHNMR